MIIPDHVEKNARLYGNKKAIVFEDRNCTFAELKERVYRLSNGLLGLGVRKGDRVAVILENCFEYPEIYYGIAKIGAVITPLNYRLIGKELAHLYNHSEAGTLIISRESLELFAHFLPQLSTLKNCICVGGDPPGGMLGYNELLSRAEARRPEILVQPDDMAGLLYTGGTTGRPKGVIQTHRNWEATAVTHAVEWGSYGQVDLIVTPLFHVGSSWYLFVNFMLGNTEVILKRVDIEEILKTVEKERVTTSSWIAPVIKQILNFPGISKYDLSSLRLVVTGAAPLREHELRKFIEIVKCRLIMGSGQTETGKTTENCVNDHLDNPRIFCSNGRDAFNVEIRVVDNDDNDVHVGGVGELVARGEGVTKGYWKMPEETARALRGGWMHTGDLVRIDENGYITYVDRKNDMINTGGEKVFSSEIEEVLRRHDAVAEVAVIGIPDEKWGEAIKALVILKPGRKATQEEILAHCREYMGGFKCPKSVEFYADFPRTGLGKIAKHELRDEYWKGYDKRIH